MKSALFYFTLCVATILSLNSCAQKPSSITNASTMNTSSQENKPMNRFDTATFGAGCFWCTEAQFQQLKGVVLVESGYAGGQIENPTYKQVCSGTTGHAEVTNIYYNPAIINFEELLEAFWMAHDPTQLNRQGNDIGTQYRSVIFYHNEEQKHLAEAFKQRLNQEKVYATDVVTEITPFSKFYKAEDYHQNYYNENGMAPYCMMVIRPKMDKFKKVFKHKLKSNQ